eukprot:scaffold26100_cov120-Isochrysis_galbana.AAC.6
MLPDRCEEVFLVGGRARTPERMANIDFLSPQWHNDKNVKKRGNAANHQAHRRVGQTADGATAASCCGARRKTLSPIDQATPPMSAARRTTSCACVRVRREERQSRVSPPSSPSPDHGPQSNIE